MKARLKAQLAEKNAYQEAVNHEAKSIACKILPKDAPIRDWLSNARAMIIYKRDGANIQSALLCTKLPSLMFPGRDGKDTYAISWIYTFPIVQREGHATALLLHARKHYELIVATDGAFDKLWERAGMRNATGVYTTLPK